MRNRAAGVYSQRPAELLRERAIYNTVYRLKSAALEDSFTTHTYKTKASIQALCNTSRGLRGNLCYLAASDAPGDGGSRVTSHLTAQI